MADQKFEMTMRVVNNNAQANGAEANLVEIYVYESETMLPASKLSLVIKVDGNATIKESNTPVYSTVTDGNGRASVNITNTVVELVNVEAYVLDDPNQKASTSVTFIQAHDVIKISKVYNRNHTFSAEQPTIAWIGASFTIETSGGSGKLEWSVLGSTAEVEVEPMSDSTKAGVTIKAHPYQATRIVVTDTLTGDKDEFVFFIKLFIVPNVDKQVHLSHAISEHGDYMLSLFNYQDLYKEWGDLTVYPQWVFSSYNTESDQKSTAVDEDFWTNEHNLVEATVANIKDGTSHDVILLSKCFYAYKTGVNFYDEKK